VREKRNSYLCSPQERKGKAGEFTEKADEKNKKIKFANNKKVLTFAVPKERGAK